MTIYVTIIKDFHEILKMVFEHGTECWGKLFTEWDLVWQRSST